MVLNLTTASQEIGKVSELRIEATGSLPELKALQAELTKTFPAVQFKLGKPEEVEASPVQQSAQRELDLYAIAIHALIGKGIEVSASQIIAFIRAKVSGGAKAKED